MDREGDGVAGKQRATTLYPLSGWKPDHQQHKHLIQVQSQQSMIKTNLCDQSISFSRRRERWTNLLKGLTAIGHNKLFICVLLCHPCCHMSSPRIQSLWSSKSNTRSEHKTIKTQTEKRTKGPDYYVWGAEGCPQVCTQSLIHLIPRIE